MKTINIIATTISGSVKDWGKLKLLGKEFRQYYPGNVEVFRVNSHEAAKEKAGELIAAGETTIVSAGGAGTFNSVLEGARLESGFSENFRLAFLRKGSADLIGKVLNIPDELKDAARIISNSVEKDKTIASDVIELKINSEEQHFIGFSGIGIFGMVPFFTENRLMKYYKGLLGSLFGDRGPFIVGAALAILKHYKDRLVRKKKFVVEIDKNKLPAKEYSSIIITNGDLGKDFPVARDMSLGDSNYQVVLLDDLGLLKACQQFVHIWKGDFEKHTEQLGVRIVKAQNMTISPTEAFEYAVNVDGSFAKTKSQICYKVSDQIRLITG